MHLLWKKAGMMEFIINMPIFQYTLKQIKFLVHTVCVAHNIYNRAF